jgi:hypothetical protein
MPARFCTVTFTDPSGVRHTVEVQAESLSEAAALGLAAWKRDARGRCPGLQSVSGTPSFRSSIP